MSDLVYGERELARAVILRAIEDARSHRDSIDRKEARLFLCATNKLWENSLKFWCYMAGWTEADIIRWARKKWTTN